MAFSLFNFLLVGKSPYFLRRAKNPPSRELKPSSPSNGSGEAVWGSSLLATWSLLSPAVAVAFWSAAVVGAAFWSLFTVLELADALAAGSVEVLGVVAAA